MATRKEGHQPLSDKQRALLQQLADGEMDEKPDDKKQRAALDQKFIRICKKLSAKNRNHAVIIAIRNRIIDPPKSPRPGAEK